MSSHLAEAIETLLRRHELTASEIARRSGISASQISKWTRGIQSSISSEDFTRLALAITSDPHEQADLVVAHLEDERFGPGAELVFITVIPDKGPLRLRDDRTVLSMLAQSEAHLHRLARLPGSDVRELLIDLARVTGLKI